MNAERRTQNAESRTSSLCVLRSAFCVLVFVVAQPAFAGSQLTARSAALSTVSPRATQIGLQVLKRGGNAVDAAVAVAFALAVVHPQAGNLGGGGNLIYYDAETKGVWTLDFREVAPLAAKRDMFANAERVPDNALACAVPGTVAGLAAAHEKFGTRPWKELLDPSVRLAREGFRVDSMLTRDLLQAKLERKIDQHASTVAVFFDNDKPVETLQQPDLAATLERIANGGAREFYEGETATRLVEAMKTAGGIIGFRDLREYKPLWRAPIKIRFGDYDLYTTAPPAAGGLVIGETLNILGGFDLAASGFQTPASTHVFAEALRRAYIDRNKYLADPVSARIPYRELLSADRATQWRRTIDPKRVTPTASLTEPGTLTASEGTQTTHFTIADAKGNIAAVTVTLNQDFGNGVLLPGLGFFMNNDMDDFAAVPGKPNREGLVQGAANAIEPGKRMASSLAPTIVLRNGAPFLALGTRGGPAIPTTVLQVFLNVVVHRKSLFDAIAAPRFHHQALPEEIAYEAGRAPQRLLDGLLALGHGIKAGAPIGDVHALQFDGGRIIAVADPREGGAAGGY